MTRLLAVEAVRLRSRLKDFKVDIGEGDLWTERVELLVVFEKGVGDETFQRN